MSVSSIYQSLRVPSDLSQISEGKKGASSSLCASFSNRVSHYIKVLCSFVIHIYSTSIEKFKELARLFSRKRRWSDDTPSKVGKSPFLEQWTYLTNCLTNRCKKQCEYLTHFCKEHPVKATIITAVVLCLIYKWATSPILPKNRDQNQCMSNLICRHEDIDAHDSIGGIHWSEIERRAHSKAWSNTKFVGKNQTVRGVIKKDWKTMETLGLRCNELTNHMKKIVDHPHGIKIGDDEGGSTVRYRFGSLKGNTINAPRQTFQVKKRLSCGFQEDIFSGEGCSNDPFSCKKQPHWLSSTDWTVKNVKTGDSIFLSSTTLQYGGDYCFFEGRNESGSKNPYRIDPFYLVQVLTGLSSQILNEIVQSRLGSG